MLKRTHGRIRALTVLFIFLVVGTPFITAQSTSFTRNAAPTQGNITASQNNNTTITEYTLPPDKMAKATALYHTGLIIFAFQTIFGFALLLALLHFRVAPLYRDIAERVARNFLGRAAIFTALFLVTVDIASLPLAIYRHHLGLAYGLSVQGWGSWFADLVKAETIDMVVGFMIVSFVFWRIRRSPDRWWFQCWLAAIPFVIFAVFITPLVIDPLFNKFQPLETTQPQLIEPLQQIAHRSRLYLPNSRMFEMDASAKYTTYNAYVTGLGATKRIVVWDNTAKDMTVGETQFVFGHELGHYVLKHIPKGIAFAIGVMFVSFWLARKVALALLGRWGDRWGIRELGDYAAFPVLLLVLSIFSFALSPINAAFSRHLEHDADIHGLEVIHGIVPDSPQVAASAFQKLGEKSYDYPHPNRLYVLWIYDHPDIASRLQFALHYQPWNEGKPNEFVK